MNSTQSVTEILNTNNNQPIGPIGKSNLNQLEPIGTTSKTNAIVDMMLSDYNDLIVPEFKAWFAKMFYNLPFDQVHRCASEARQEGNNPQRLFAFKIRQIAR